MQFSIYVLGHIAQKMQEETRQLFLLVYELSH